MKVTDIVTEWPVFIYTCQLITILQKIIQGCGKAFNVKPGTLEEWVVVMVALIIGDAGILKCVYPDLVLVCCICTMVKLDAHSGGLA